MRLLTLALAMAAALVLVVVATAARKPAPPPPSTPTAFGTPVFVATPSANGLHRATTLTVPFTHSRSVALRLTITVNGVLVCNAGTVATYRGTGSETYRLFMSGTDAIAPERGDTISYHLQLVAIRDAWIEGAPVLAELTTPAYDVT